MKAAELRAKSEGDLKSELIDLLRAQFSLRMQVATQQLGKVDQIGKVRRDIARVRTILAEKARQAALAQKARQA
ncbi:MAG TPA: 50S ribosomal protein L29 [Methylophilaceae bacterium]